MRILFPLFLVTLTVLSAEPLRQWERDRALSDLHATRTMYLQTVKELTPEQWSFVPPDGGWSIAQIAEHLAVSEEKLLQHASETVMATEPQTPLGDVDLREGDAAVRAKLADRGRNAEAPEFLKPADRIASGGEAAAAFDKSRRRTIEFIRDTQEPLRSHRVMSEQFGELDAYQWILLISAHTGRHLEQIREVMDSSGFPE